MGRERSSAIVLCLWPGLTRLWLSGRWSGLLTAVGFTFLLNAALSGAFVWPQLFDMQYLTGIWLATAMFWIWSAIASWINLPDELVGNNLARPEQTELLYQAQTEYLGGHYEESISLLQRLLKLNPKDVDGRFLLASNYRHQFKWDLAKEEIQNLQRFDLSVKWQNEITRELELIERSEQEELEEESSDRFSEILDESDDRSNNFEEPTILPINQRDTSRKKAA